MMQEQPLISIVMPAYNAEKTIREAIESVIAQTYQNWELIVVDDCSTDSTNNLLQCLLETDTRIKVFHNACNYGVSETRNNGVKQSSGDWIAFLDSDDMWKKEKLQKQINLLKQKTNGDIIFTGSAFVDNTGKSNTFILKVPDEISYCELLKQNLISCSSALVKKEWLIRYPMKHDDMHEDYAVWLQILKSGGHAYGVNEPLLVYRLSKNSKSGNKRKAAYMTYRVYRYVGLNFLQALYYFCWYACKNLRKYKYISDNA